MLGRSFRRHLYLTIKKLLDHKNLILKKRILSIRVKKNLKRLGQKKLHKPIQRKRKRDPKLIKTLCTSTMEVTKVKVKKNLRVLVDLDHPQKSFMTMIKLQQQALPCRMKLRRSMLLIDLKLSKKKS